jgi:hypothetical protein
MADYN